MDISGLTLTTIGEVILAVMILRVHWIMLKAHSINEKEVKFSIRREEIIGVIAILFIVIGYVLQLCFKVQ